jgi:hypothetical protein
MGIFLLLSQVLLHRCVGKIHFFYQKEINCLSSSTEKPLKVMALLAIFGMASKSISIQKKSVFIIQGHLPSLENSFFLSDTDAVVCIVTYTIIRFFDKV